MGRVAPGNSDQRTRTPSSQSSPIPKGGASYWTSVGFITE